MSCTPFTVRDYRRRAFASASTISAILVLAIAYPRPTPFQVFVFRTILSVAAAGAAALIPGFLEVEISNWVRAGGALAVFVIVY
jgi:hypothetical protein